MRSPIIRLPARPRSRRRASALILTLIFTGVLAISVAAMLLSVRHLARSTDDKVAFEEAYVVGLSGLAAAKSWLMKPQLAISHLGSTDGMRFAAITSGALALSNEVREHKTDLVWLKGRTGDQILGYFTPHDANLGSAGSLAGDRRVLYEFTATDERLIKFRNGQSTASLFGTTDSNARSYVRRLRITTPFRSEGTSGAGPYMADDLRRVSLILEAEAVAVGTGVPKTRILQQKVLIIPGIDAHTAPGLAPGAAVTTSGGAGITVGSGSSSLSIHWGPGWSTNNISILDLTFDAAGRALTAKDKFFGAGIDTKKDGSDKWLKWQTSALLIDNQTGNPIFRDAASTSLTDPTINGVPVTDLFVQMLNGSFGEGWAASDFQLGGDYLWHGKGEWAGSSTGEGILYDPRPENQSTYPVGSGALVQKDPDVIVRVNNLINKELDYTTWKTYAIANNGYVRPTGTAKKPEFVNNDGQILYVTPGKTLTTNPSGNTKLTSLDQLSMANLIPSSRNTSAIPDRILFVDTLNGTPTGSYGTVPIASTFFWKGLFYCMANVDATGVAANQTVLMKNPDDYNTDPTGNSTGTIKKSCLMDGVMYVAGNYTATGSGNIYGSLICKGGFAGGSTMDVWFNSRNKFGLFRDPSGGPKSKELKEMVSGPIAENQQYL